jgi:hypothetical protein
MSFFIGCINEEKKMRNLPDVIESMKHFIPQSEGDLLRSLDSISTSAKFAAPELMSLHWIRVSQELRDAIGEFPTKDWHFEVLALFSDNSVEKIRTELAKLIN